MNSRCENIQNQALDYILGVLEQEKINTFNQHVSECKLCQNYLKSLENENRLLMQFGDSLETTMNERRLKAINAINPTEYTHSIWSIIMRKKIAHLSAAAIIIISAIFVVSIMDRSATPAYAFNQTVKAIKKVQTVYMAGEFYKQGKFECWMKYDGNPDKPTHVWLGRDGEHICKICSPDGVFGLNKRTNRVHFATRDERSKGWILKFSSFFKDAVKKAGRTNSIIITYEIDAETEKEMVVVNIKTSKIEQKFFVDPDTKLPISFTTLRDDDPMEMMRKTLAVKNLTEIRYNEEPPEGIFDMPIDAVVVEEEVDCMVDPDSGLIAGGMTKQEACLEIIKRTGQALVDMDIETLCKLDLFFRLYPPEIWEQVKKLKEDGKWIKEVVITGQPYQEEELWYVPLEIRYQTGKNEVQNAMIKFYELEGKNLCFIIGSKEKGIVD